MRVTSLHHYPIKSTAGSRTMSLEIEPWGAAGDRRWLVVSPAGQPLTARTLPRLLTLRARPHESGINVRAADGAELYVETPTDGVHLPVEVSRYPMATDAGDPAARFLSRVLQTDVRLVWQADPRDRSVNPLNGGLPGESLSLADAGPLLLTTRASLAQLQDEVGGQLEIAMERFRPNVVVDALEPLEELGWSRVEIDGLPFRVQEPCDRCVMTNIDPITLERQPEPLQTLREKFSVGGRPMFGVRLVPLDVGVVTSGATVSAR